MGFHHAHNVGRVLHGEHARQEMELHKRINYVGTPIMHVPENYNVAENDVQTAVSVVYVTLSQTFNGPASFSTITNGNAAATSTPAVNSAVTSADDSAPTTAASATPIDAAASSSISLSPDESSSYLAAQSAAQATSGSAVSTGLLLATSSLAFSPTATHLSASSTGAAYTSSNGASAAASTGGASVSNATVNGGMSGAAKAGLIIALIVAVGMAFGLGFFCWRRKKNPNGGREMLDEKHASFADASARSYESRHMQNTKAAAMMPQKVPSDVRATRTTSTAPRLSLRPASSFLPMLGGAAATNNNAPPQNNSAWERRPGATKQNPFDDISEKQSRPNSPPTNPFEENNAANPSGRTSPSNAESNHAPIGTAVAGPGPVNAAQPPRGPNNVHRVQLDFKPSMEDELELRSGQLVRMLHEYDDGWALCIRMDRSQQGVAPRTCLSKLPVKPRPQGPPSNSRPGTSHSEGRPSMQSQRSISPQEPSSRGPSPDLGPVPNRKPVPGQAM